MQSFAMSVLTEQRESWFSRHLLQAVQPRRGRAPDLDQFGVDAGLGDGLEHFAQQELGVPPSAGASVERDGFQHEISLWRPSDTGP